MLVSTKGRYATRMLLDIAMHQEQDGYVSMKDVAERQQISKKYMETFTAQLASAGILSIRRGKTGGYRLLRDPSEVSLLDILQLTEGSMHAVSCLECQPNQCPRAAFCTTLPAWAGLEKAVYDYLSSINLRTLMDKAVPQPEGITEGSCGE